MRTDEGATRKVFIFKSFVIKVPTLVSYQLFLTGILANLQESTFSGAHPDLAKVKYCGPLGLFVVMEKAEVVAGVNWREFQDMIIDRYKDDTMRDFMISDSKPSNWGYIDGKLVKIDYGS